MASERGALLWPLSPHGASQTPSQVGLCGSLPHSCPKPRDLTTQGFHFPMDASMTVLSNHLSISITQPSIFLNNYR